jgi:hypothetical protein
MRYLQKLLITASLITMTSSCYVHHRRGYLARRSCDYGWHLDRDGDRCVPDRPYRRW